MSARLQIDSVVGSVKLEKSLDVHCMPFACCRCMRSKLRRASRRERLRPALYHRNARQSSFCRPRPRSLLPTPGTIPRNALPLSRLLHVSSYAADMRYALCALAILLSAVEVLAAGQIPYGSRVGMNVTITSLSGIGTPNAVIRVKHTRENAREFCVEYSDDRSEKCVNDKLRTTRLSDEIHGNCRNGFFTTLYGVEYQFRGKVRKRSEFDPLYVVVGPEGKLDGSGASGYSEALLQFQALCPALVDTVE